MTRLLVVCQVPGCEKVHGIRTVPASRRESQPDLAVGALGGARVSRDGAAAPFEAPGASEAPRGLARAPVRSIPPERLSSA